MGVIVVLAADVLPPDAETRLTDFTHLVASSISNVQARNSLIASRARIVTASDETRRRIERNLHDGIQQRVVSVALSLRARSPIPVTLEVTGGPRFREPVEIAIYYVVSEALANAAKHSRATEISVTVTSGESGARAAITDDGRGARPGHRRASEPLSFPQAAARVTLLNGARRGGVGGESRTVIRGALSARTLNGVSQSSGSGTAERVRLEYTIVEVACRAACVVEAPSGFEVMPAR